MMMASDVHRAQESHLTAGRPPSISGAWAGDRQVRKQPWHLTRHRVCPMPAGRAAQLEAQLQRAQDTGEADRAALQAARGELDGLRSQAAEAEAAEAMHLAHQASCLATGSGLCGAPHAVLLHTVQHISLRLLVALVGSLMVGVHTCAGGHCWAAGSLHPCIPACSWPHNRPNMRPHAAAGRV